MDRSERFHKIDSLLLRHGIVSIDRMLEELEVSRATFKRDIEYMRDRLHAPIEWDRDAGGYRYSGDGPELGRQALPGLWFNSSEAYALLTMQAVLADMQPGLLGGHIEPLKARLRALIETGHQAASDVESRVKLLTTASRAVPDKHFEVVASALFRRERLELAYYGRERGESSRRLVSPQLLIHYRSNWYLVAWCHEKEGLRSFAMDSIEDVEALSRPASRVSKQDLDDFVGNGYGIFSGRKLTWARLRFSAERARWVERERWHAQQRATRDDKGRLILEVPYTDARELTMDILRHGPHVEVLGPSGLRSDVRRALSQALQQYADA
ncbi:helix-turn-helix transcriptional regulator [Variovorax sp. M-6]|uniref:helix-turn-helix transcriptional regulator n=1 Tax=Variovorax sp. M-6 TaxID=3233041 RepID=UPI003F9BC39A